jgi:hypothetical protein
MADSKGPEFDPDLNPHHCHNQEAAKAQGLHYNAATRSYVDEDGCLVRDEFGQKY